MPFAPPINGSLPPGLCGELLKKDHPYLVPFGERL